MKASQFSRKVGNDVIGKHILKIVSLFLACSLWFYVLNSEPLEVDVKIPMSLINPPGLASKLIVPQVVQVKLKGARAFVKNLGPENLKVFVDLNKYRKKRKFKVKISNSDIPIPFGVEVIKITPAFFEVELEKEIKKKISIKAKLVGELPSDLKLVSHKISPKEIMIRGPRSIMKKIGQIHTVPIDIGVLEGEHDLKVSLESLDSRIKQETKVSSIDFSYVVRTNKANLTLKNVKISFLTTKRRIRSATKAASLDVLIPAGREKGLTQSEIKVIAEIPDSVNGNARIKLKAILPDGIHLLQIHPEYININVK